jgi:hypothetical protein
MDIDVLARQVRELTAFRDKYEPMLKVAQAGYDLARDKAEREADAEKTRLADDQDRADRAPPPTPPAADPQPQPSA